MKRLFFLILAVCCLFGVQAQMAITVTGQVLDGADNEPLVGATVTPVGEGQPVATNLDGNFTIKVAPTVSQLQVSYIGMATQTVNITPGFMTITLQPNDNRLDEVMVVAFGTAKKSAFTGSAAVVNADDLAKHVSTNVADALVGSVPGLSIRQSSGAPGSGQGSISIRGLASMYASTEPLIIVDGSPYPGNLSNIPQSDIESVTVLKDAASAALYGARGATGVILITTKRGNTQKARVNVDAKWGSNSRAVQRYDLIRDPGKYYEAFYAQFNNYFLYNGNTAAYSNERSNYYTLNYLKYNIFTLPEGQNLIGMDGKINQYATKGRTFTGLGGLDYYLTNDDWMDVAYSDALRQEYNVSIDGGNDVASYYASLAYLDDQGILENSSYKRVTARFKGDYQAKKWLRLGVNASYVNSTTQSNDGLGANGSNDIGLLCDNIAPIFPVYVRVIDPTTGQPTIYIDEYGHQSYDYGIANRVGQGYGMTRPYMSPSNPIGSNRYNDINQRFNMFNGNFTLDINFTDYLKGNITSNVTWSEAEGSSWRNPWYDTSASTNGNIAKSNSTYTRTNNIQTLTFMKSFDLHNLNIMAGHEYYRENMRYLYAQATGGFSPEIKEIAAFATVTDATTSYNSAYNVEGYFGRVQYDYDDKYFGTFSYRRDASSRFDKDHRWGNFWSVGAAWIINKDFFTNLKWMDMLKVKLSIGQQGNDNIGNWAYVDLFSISPDSKTSMAASFYRLGNSDITWETTTNFNAGIEFSAFQNRLGINIDGYYKKTSDLLFWLNVPESMGTRGYYDNIGDIANYGVEVELKGGLIREKNIGWDLNVNLAHNKSRILSLPEAKIQKYGGFFESESDYRMFQCWYEVGKPLYNITLPKYAGVNEEGLALYYTDSDIDPENQNVPATKMDDTTTDFTKAPDYEVGCAFPVLTGGFSTSVRLWNFDLSANFDFQVGGKILDLAYAGYMAPSTGGGNFHKDWIKSWSPENTSSNIPRWQYGDNYTASRSDRFLTNASYLNFQSFTIGYTLPKFWKEISNIRVYCIGENLCFWSARKGLDPRYSFGTRASTSVYSPVRNISGGIQVTF